MESNWKYHNLLKGMKLVQSPWQLELTHTLSLSNFNPRYILQQKCTYVCTKLCTVFIVAVFVVSSNSEQSKYISTGWKTEIKVYSYSGTITTGNMNTSYTESNYSCHNSSYPWGGCKRGLLECNKCLFPLWLLA